MRTLDSPNNYQVAYKTYENTKHAEESKQFSKE